MGPLLPMPLVTPGPRQPAKKRVGMLQLVPVVSPPGEQLASALKRAARAAPNAAIKNEAEKERSRAAKQLDCLMKELSVPLTKYLSGFPKAGALHPFEAALLDLTVGRATYASVVAKVDALRKALQEVGKAYANRASKAANKREAAAAAEEGTEMLTKVFTKGARAIDDLKRVSKQLRSLPYVEPQLPTLALVGAPNVGKSSLVQVLSSGTPEICDYPFTTRSIKMGHFWVDARKHQVTDTPGLLARPDDQRNAMELLTLAALSYLPSSVVFVADLTEGCGTSCADQWAIRSELRRRFADKVWIDVLSKSDLLADVWALADSADPAPCGGGMTESGSSSSSSSSSGGGSGPPISSGGDVSSPSGRQAAGGEGHAVVLQVNGAAAQAAPSSAADDNSSTSSSGAEGASGVSSGGGGSGGGQDPVLLFARLPGALRVSSLTGEGVDALKGRVMEELQRAAAEAAAEGEAAGEALEDDAAGDVAGAAAEAL